MADEIKKSGVSGEVQGIDDLEERLARLSKAQMAEIIKFFYVSADAIFNLGTYPIGMSPIFNRDEITDEMIIALGRSINHMWHLIMSAEIDRLKKMQE